jgi:hypothetical protein
MPTIRITVLRDGEPVDRHKVTLGVSGIDGGMIGPEYTDSRGMAEFGVQDGQEGTVYVDGSNQREWGSYSRTDITVNL